MLSSARSSTPLKMAKRLPTALITLVRVRMSPLDSLIATYFGSAAISTYISGVMLTP
ncbi:hypothetical protein D3C72_2326330 [compost metagenome]